MNAILRSSGCFAIAVGLLTVAPTGRSPQSDVDDLMARVLAVRDENWKKLQQYVLDEREQFDVLGPGNVRLWGERREYTWYIREGFFVRSPVSANGAAVSDAERVKYEADFLTRAKNKERPAETAGRPDEPSASDPPDSPATVGGLLAQTRQPQFVDAAYFLRFRFEPGRYAFVGRETIAGRNVLRIDYFPERLFRHEQDDQDARRRQNRRDRNEDVEAAMERAMNKVSLVTLWIDPELRQIVKYTFDNVDLDFLPAAWLLRVDDLEASMTMGEMFPGVWLPRRVEMVFSAMLAVGDVRATYELDYLNYRQATTAGRVKTGAE